jgi:hypothetical protein
VRQRERRKEEARERSRGLNRAEIGDDLRRKKRIPMSNFFSQATSPARNMEGKWRGGAWEYGGEEGRQLLALGEKGEGRRGMASVSRREGGG